MSSKWSVGVGWQKEFEICYNISLKSIERCIKYSLYLGQEEGAAAFPEEYEFPTMEQLGEQVSLTPPPSLLFPEEYEFLTMEQLGEQVSLPPVPWGVRMPPPWKG